MVQISNQTGKFNNKLRINQIKSKALCLFGSLTNLF